MSICVQILLGIMATVAAIASAIAAWKSRSIAKSALDFQKALARHQQDIFLMRDTISKLWQLKRLIENPLASDDDEFNRLHSIHVQIRQNISSLTESGVIESRESRFFSPLSWAEIVDEMPDESREINIEINRLEAKINQIFS